jgi:acyl carrier protein
MEEKLKEIFVDILEVDESALHNNFGPEDSPLWDSMNNLRLVTAIEEEFGIKLSMAEIESMDTFGKIRELIIQHM